MRLEDWETALQSFTEVVEQEPEEGDAWANVAAIHMHNKNPSEAYPALNEVRKAENTEEADYLFWACLI
jgi:Tfp pilus assembly protein PilF